ncbi:hypothetical protein EBU24_03600, partial [bacterium]|nr:hypothetical protein [bacterium]
KHHDAYKAKKDDEVELKESSYVCLKCNMRFSCFTAKKIHRDAFHKGEEPFPCIFCTKAFWSKSSLSGHANREHSEDLSEINKFVCLQCGNSYENQNKLKFHYRYSATCIKNADNDDMQEDAVVKRAKIDISQDVENTEINIVATTNHYREEIAKIEAAQILLSMKSKKN